MSATKFPQPGDVTIDSNPLATVREGGELPAFAEAIIAVGDEAVTRSTTVEFLNVLRGATNGLTALVAANALNDGQREHLQRTIELLSL